MPKPSPTRVLAAVLAVGALAVRGAGQQPPVAPGKPSATAAPSTPTPASPVAAKPPAGVRELITTADGSRFLLAPDEVRFGAPVIHWVTLVPTGLEEDPVGAEGLARAIVRASLDGSGGTGSLDAEREANALDVLDAIERRAATARKGEEQQIQAERSAAAAAAASLGIPDSWRRALARAGATDVELRELDGASLIHVALPTEALPDVALLIRERRERPLLRGLREQFAKVHSELLVESGSPRGRMAREILGATFPGDANARPIQPVARIFARAEALAEFAAIHSPTRGLQVLTGGFDIAEVSAALRAIFAATQLAPTTAPPAPTPADSRGRRAVIPGGEDTGVSIAWPMPKGDPWLVVGTAEWLAGGRSSLLASSLRGAGFGAVEVGYRVSYPARARPGLLLIQVIGERRNAKAKELESTVLTILANAGARGPAREEIGRVEPRLRVLGLSWVRAPREASFVLAELVGLRGRPVESLTADPPRPKAEELAAVLADLQSLPQRTVVSLQGAQ